MLKKVQTLEEAKELLPKFDYQNTDVKARKNRQEVWHIGSVNLDENGDHESSEFFKTVKWLMEDVLPPLKYFKWGDILDIRKADLLLGFNGLNLHADTYLEYLHKGYTAKHPDPNYNAGAFGFKNINDEYQTLHDLVNIEPKEALDEDSFHSIYYHASKAHWIIQSIREEGLRHPIQGVSELIRDKHCMRIHPGSVRSAVFEEMEDPNMELFIWDFSNIVPDVKALTAEEVFKQWYNILKRKDAPHYNLSAIFVDGILEFQMDLASLDFRQEVYDFNKKVHKLTKGKPLNIYVGYDSRHGDLTKITETAILQTVKQSWGSGQYYEHMEFTPEVKLLDHATISEYTREYANQSTEFTYSRFLIPYLENYEGFSIFLDDDFIFNKTLLPMFYYLNPDDAIACIQYPQYKHDETKFKGEVNIDYPRKLWSSLMVFNNGHEDCKKLTPEAVNTWTGKQLHQFEWTEKISEIPQKYIFVEGYDDPDVKWDYSGIHYTRGGPWVKDMDYDHINNLKDYYFWKEKMVVNGE